jgi:glycine/D-amino acid oxidase-like deaminating enzyme
MEYSYWESAQYQRRNHLIIIGSGIVGLMTALLYKQKYPNRGVMVLERGWLPEGASTRNAGFACFGSAGEIADDLTKMPSEEVWETVKMRIEGLHLLREIVGDKQLKFRLCGGIELFKSTTHYERILEQALELNSTFKSLTGLANVYSPSTSHNNFNGLKGSILNQYEGDIDTGALMRWLIKNTAACDVPILTGTPVIRLHEKASGVDIETQKGLFKAEKVVVATNGFASQLLPLPEVLPARAQVLVTNVLEYVPFKGTFHFDEGFYYFREIDGRVLFGGGRNLDIEGETTFQKGLSEVIQSQLELLLKEMILPGRGFTIEQRWSGTMGIGKIKKPIIQQLSERTFCGVRMGGMGVAIGTKVAEKIIQLLE